jgi:serine/threonine-protein kinase SRPK3
MSSISNLLHNSNSQDRGHGLGRFSRSRQSPPGSHGHADTISAFKQIEEETLPKYNVNAFYPTRLDEVLNDRYQVITKLGFGVTATVWLARDLEAQKSGRKYVTIKINVNTLSDDWLKGRRKIAERLATANPNHPGYNHVRFMLDTFKLKGPHGQHLCVVYDVLRGPIGATMEKLPGHLFSSDNLRILLPALLQGLDYMHSEAHVVHTDLKADNIMMGLGDPTILDKVVQDEARHPSARKMPDSHGRIIYQSHGDFGVAPTDAIIASAKITDIGLADWGDERHNYAIQSNAFTAPEVILAATWSYPADIWNLGVMLWDLFENFGLFDAIDTGPSRYHPTQHLGLMIALMGPPPKELLERGSTSATYFDEEGRFRHPKLIREGFSFESSITRFKGKDKELFIDFTKKMICWLPEERWTAKQLLGHPWLKHRDVEDGENSLSSFQPDEDAKQAKATPAPTTNSVSSNTSTSTSTSTTTVKTDSNAVSGNLIRAILDR